MKIVCVSVLFLSLVINARTASLQRIGTADKCYPTEKYDWTYNYACSSDVDGQLPPDMWHVNYPDCAGNRQSPVNLDIEHVVEDMCDKAPVNGPFHFSNEACTYGSLVPHPTVKNWEITFDKEACGGTLPSVTVSDGKTYTLQQFHFHSASEHTIGGGYYDAELHMVHVNPSDPMDYMVIGFMFNVNSVFMDNIEISKYWSVMDDDSEMGISDEIVQPYDMVPPSGTYYSYLGSLTTPPCLEVVNWVVMEQPIHMSPSQLQKMRESYAEMEYTLADMGGNNFRPTQDLGERKLYKCNM